MVLLKLFCLKLLVKFNAGISSPWHFESNCNVSRRHSFLHELYNMTNDSGNKEYSNTNSDIYLVGFYVYQYNYMFCICILWNFSANISHETLVLQYVQKKQVVIFVKKTKCIGSFLASPIFIWKNFCLTLRNALTLWDCWSNLDKTNQSTIYYSDFYNLINHI